MDNGGSGGGAVRGSDVYELEEFAGGEIADEVTVGGDEVELGEIAQRAPAHILEDEVFDLASVFPHEKELQIDGASIAVVMADVGDQRADGSVDAKFFLKFATQGLFGGFACFHLPTGKLPLGAERLVGTPLTDQQLIATQDESGSNGPYRLYLVVWLGRPFVTGSRCRICLLPIRHLILGHLID